MGGMDIDSLLKDLDEKFKELDRKEAEKKQGGMNPLFNFGEDIQMPKKKADPIVDDRIDKNIFTNVNDNELNAKENIGENPSVLKTNDNPPLETKKPIINVDTDSKVIDDNVISDDEFFDDFFGDE